MIPHEIDMVFNHHQLAGLESRVDTTRRIGQDKPADSHAGEHPYGKRHFLHAVALVIVEAALHDPNPYPRHPAPEQTALVAFNRAHRKTGDILIRQPPLNVHQGVHHCSPARPENQKDSRTRIPFKMGAYFRGRLSCIQFFHMLT